MAKRRKTPLWRRQRPSTRMKRKFAKFTGIPTTRSGRKAKLRRLLLPGCALPVICAVSAIVALVLSLI